MALTGFSSLKNESLKQALKNASVAVIGLGKSGLSASELLINLESKVFISDANPKMSIDLLPPSLQRAAERGQLEAEFGAHGDRISKSDLVIVSPGVHWDLPQLEEARDAGIPIWAELELGYRLVQTGMIAAITGTNGKSTTVSLLADMCRQGEKKTLLAGNIGQPLCDFALKNEAFDITVLEVSSYQLEGIVQFHPHVAAVLNVTNDHLEHHKTMENYAEAKTRVFMNQKADDVSILNFEDPWCRKMRDRTQAKRFWISTLQTLKQGVYADPDRRKIVAKQGNLAKEFPYPAHLPGLHNIENSCAAVAAAIALGISDRAISHSLAHFPGVEHRLENTRVLRGVEYINDSKATNVDSTLKALESFQKPLWLILGGQDKGGSYLPIKNFILRAKRSESPVKGIALIGEASDLIEKALRGSAEMFFCKTLDAAVKELAAKASEGEIVLLSPACASFDQFKNFEDRGRKFKQFVNALP